MMWYSYKSRRPCLSRDLNEEGKRACWESCCRRRLCAIPKGPEVGMCLAFSRHKRSLVKDGNLTVDEVREVGKDQISGPSKAEISNLNFILPAVGRCWRNWKSPLQPCIWCLQGGGSVISPGRGSVTFPALCLCS